MWCYITGRYPSLYFRFCWLIASPALLLALWVASLVDYTPPGYRHYQYPAWAQALGWIIASLSLLCIPVYAVIVIIRAPGSNLREVRINLTNYKYVQLPFITMPQNIFDYLICYNYITVVHWHENYLDAINITKLETRDIIMNNAHHY